MQQPAAQRKQLLNVVSLQLAGTGLEVLSSRHTLAMEAIACPEETAGYGSPCCI